MADIVNVYVTRGKPFIVPCSHCNKGTEFPTPDGPGPLENPFTFTCRCGRETQVQMNFRQAIRKRVTLTGAVTFGLRRPEACSVEDLSRTGVHLTVGSSAVVKVGQRAVVKLVLDDRQANQLTLTGTVRRTALRGPRLSVGVEFSELPPHEAQVLAFYFM